MNETKLEFYPKHPSAEKTHRIETGAMPRLETECPLEVRALYDEFSADRDAFLEKYTDKRFCVTGTVKKVGPDIHNKPSVELSDHVDGRTYALVIFPTDEHYGRVRVGDTVTVCANYLVMSNLFGTVMKYGELVSVEGCETAPCAE